MAGLTAKQIEAAGNDVPDGQRFGRLDVPLFGGPVPFYIEPDEDAPEGAFVSADMVTALNNFLTLPQSRFADVQAALAAHCRECSATTDYGSRVFEEPGEDLTVANYRYFGLHADGTAPSGWFQPKWLFAVSLQSYPEAHVAITFYPPWEDEHGCNLKLQDDQFVSFNM